MGRPKHSTRRVEHEFGVPFPGEVLPRQRWTRTAFELPAGDSRLDWCKVFGRRAPVVLDLGCGNGRFLIWSAVERPELDHFGIDSLPVVIQHARRRSGQRGLTNARFAVGDARELIERRVPARSVAEVHVYHPQPYHDPSKSGLRLIDPEFLALVHAALLPGGLFFLQTDSRAYWEYLLRVIPSFFDFRLHEGPWKGSPRGRTRREIIAIRKNLTVFRGWGPPLGGLDREEALSLAHGLPRPEFVSERRPRRTGRESAKGDGL